MESFYSSNVDYPQQPVQACLILDTESDAPEEKQSEKKKITEKALV